MHEGSYGYIVGIILYVDDVCIFFLQVLENIELVAGWPT